eukprot:TRINITY_DN6580_c0_g1_i1.p1 TRINITY_DN6580_c0_g1~~TRINITY_DN6580_c0_g1_i1.p1  ORF type:complete len:385 (+),score=126.94 TRINITY_DN6580_c0_g1_i1:208-1362(+)
MSEDPVSVVLDCGGCNLKFGLHSSEAPNYCMATIAKPMYDKTENVDPDMARKHYIGSEVQQYRALCDMTWPMKDGMVQDGSWDDMEILWKHIWDNEMRIEPAEDVMSILMTDAPLNPLSQREKTAEIMFDSFGFKNIYVTLQALCSLYQNGRSTGCVLQSGGQTTSVVPISDEYYMPHAIQRCNYGGQSVDAYLSRVLQSQSGLAFTSSSEMLTIKSMKESVNGADPLFYVSQHYDEDMKDTSIGATYKFPDDSEVQLHQELFMGPEFNFNPGVAGLPFQGFAVLAKKAIDSCNIELRGELSKNVLLAGANTMFKGTDWRMKDEMEKLGGDAAEVKVVAPPERAIGSWCGAKILADLSYYKSNLMISKKDYEEQGASIVRRVLT